MQTIAVGMGIGLLVLIAFIHAGMPKSDTLEFLIRLAQGVGAYLSARLLQQETIKHHISRGGSMADSITDVLAIGFAGVLAFLMTIMGSFVIWEIVKFCLNIN